MTGRAEVLWVAGGELERGACWVPLGSPDEGRLKLAVRDLAGRDVMILVVSVLFRPGHRSFGHHAALHCSYATSEQQVRDRASSRECPLVAGGRCWEGWYSGEAGDELWHEEDARALGVALPADVSRHAIDLESGVWGRMEGMYLGRRAEARRLGEELAGAERCRVCDGSGVWRSR